MPDSKEQTVIDSHILLFLTRAAIPCITEKNKLPEELRKQKERSENNLIWECVYRAHRDVLSGRKYVKAYSAHTLPTENKAQRQDAEAAQLNEIALHLYATVVSRLNGKETLCSKPLIEELKNSYADVPLGQLQKLVNMTLKYLVIWKVGGYLDIEIDQAECDCPLDSRILESLQRKEKWTSLTDESIYCDIQKLIQEEIKKDGEGLSKLDYDFRHWQSL